MKSLLDNFINFNNTDIHLNKLQLCFLKCHEFDINLNLEKCAFMVFFSVILGFIVFKKGNFMIQRICNYLEYANSYESYTNPSFKWSGSILQMFL